MRRLGSIPEEVGSIPEEDRVFWLGLLSKKGFTRWDLEKTSRGTGKGGCEEEKVVVGRKRKSTEGLGILG